MTTINRFSRLLCFNVVHSDDHPRAHIKTHNPRKVWTYVMGLEKITLQYGLCYFLLASTVGIHRSTYTCQAVVESVTGRRAVQYVLSGYVRTRVENSYKIDSQTTQVYPWEYYLMKTCSKYYDEHMHRAACLIAVTIGEEITSSN